MSNEINLLSFKGDKTRLLLEKFGYSIEKDGTIYDDYLKEAVCESCYKKITLRGLGMIMPGSRKLLCKNSTCFLKYLAEKEEKEGKNKSVNPL